MNEQTSIPKGKIGRAAALAGAGARIGRNYASYHTRKFLSGNDDREALHRANATDTYRTLSRLKGGPLKVAQMLSIDTALLPTAYATEFAQAYYSAPPLSYPLVERTFQREFGRGPADLFDEFSRQAVSGASIGQVHKARLGDRWLAVKVQYPGVADSLRNDMRIVKPLAMRLFSLSASDIEPYMKEVEARLLEAFDDDVARVGERHGAHAELRHPLYQRSHPDQPVDQGVFAVQPQVDKIIHGSRLPPLGAVQARSGPSRRRTGPKLRRCTGVGPSRARASRCSRVG